MLTARHARARPCSDTQCAAPTHESHRPIPIPPCSHCHMVLWLTSPRIACPKRQANDPEALLQQLGALENDQQGAAPHDIRATRASAASSAALRLFGDGSTTGVSRSEPFGSSIMCVVLFVV